MLYHTCNAYANGSCTIFLRILYKSLSDIHDQSPIKLYAISQRVRDWPWVSNDNLQSDFPI